MRIEIKTRYNHESDNTRMYRIGGNVSEIIMFNENKLESTKNIKLGDVESIGVCEKENQLILKLEDELEEGEIIEALPKRLKKNDDVPVEFVIKEENII